MRHPLAVLVVGDDDQAVLRLVHVHLEDVGAEGEGALERREGVLGKLAPGAPVREDERPSFRVPFSMRSRRHLGRFIAQPWARLAVVLGAVAVALVAGETSAFAASDPRLQYKTLETPHARITFYDGEREAAEHIADLVEQIHDGLADAVGWAPKEKTEILLVDTSEAANGSASAVPYNAIRLILTAPEDMSPLGDVDDWYRELTTHEYTHILHIDHLHGIPAIVNALLGKTLVPNQYQPRWILEGLATYHETARTSGGRLRNPMWNMFLRADVREGNVATIDQMSHFVRRYPQGNLAYLYGSSFIQFIAETYGEGALRKMAHEYGAGVIPWGINRAIRRATGQTFNDMYPAWIASLRREFDAQIADVTRRGLREGTRLTHTGQTVLHPRWIPEGAFDGHAGHLLYYLDDNHDRTGFYVLPLDRAADGRVTRVGEKGRELLVRTGEQSSPAFAPDGSLVFNSLATSNRIFQFGDLFRLPKGATSSFGLETSRERLTRGFRAMDPSVSPDGRQVVFTTNHRGTRYLQIADLPNAPGEELVNLRTLVPSFRFEQAFTPRFSPDGKYVAYSTWRKGGYRDIRLVDVKSGTFVDLATDRAQDGGPSFSPDGRFVLFHSDRTGITNVYAWEIATHELHQVTNVTTGAYEPELSPDGKTLAYVGYTSAGFDLFALPFREEDFLPALPYVDPHPPVPPDAPHRNYEVREYDPLETLVPRRYAVQITPGNFGQGVTITASGSDLAGIHAIGATMRAEIDQPQITGGLSYTYGRLPFDISMSASRSVVPRPIGIGSYRGTAIEETISVASGIQYAIPRTYDAQVFAASYSTGRTAANYTFPIEAYDPFELPRYGYRGQSSYLHFGYTYSSAESYLYSTATERGFVFSTSLDLTDSWLASDFRGYATEMNVLQYISMPWLRHHTVALHLGAGTGGGVFPGRGTYFLSGLVELPIVDVLRNSLIQGGYLLRGYEVGSAYGDNYVLSNAEYRFPIWNVDRGVSSLPLFLNRIHGAVFADWGSAFNVANDAKFKLGTGAEVTLETILGYYGSFYWRLGFAHGWQSGGLDKFYFVAAVPY